MLLIIPIHTYIHTYIQFSSVRGAHFTLQDGLQKKYIKNNFSHEITPSSGVRACVRVCVHLSNATYTQYNRIEIKYIIMIHTTDYVAAVVTRKTNNGNTI